MYLQDIVILLDTSGSMTGLRKEIAKHVVINIMETLGEDDFVTVLTFSHETKPLVECFTDSDGEPELVQATNEYIAEFTEAIYLKDPGPFDVVSQNFSLRSAHFKTAQDTCVLMNLFPALSRRSLQRRMSEELGARTPQGPQADDAPDAAAPSVPR